MYHAEACKEVAPVLLRTSATNCAEHEEDTAEEHSELDMVTALDARYTLMQSSRQPA